MRKEREEEEEEDIYLGVIIYDDETRKKTFVSEANYKSDHENKSEKKAKRKERTIKIQRCLTIRYIQP